MTTEELQGKMNEALHSLAKAENDLEAAKMNVRDANRHWLNVMREYRKALAAQKEGEKKA